MKQSPLPAELDWYGFLSGKSEDIVHPVIYISLLELTYIPWPASVMAPPRYVENTMLLPVDDNVVRNTSRPPAILA